MRRVDDHPVGRHLERITDGFVERCTRLIRAGRTRGTLPAGPPARVVALALFGAWRVLSSTSPARSHTTNCSQGAPSRVCSGSDQTHSRTLVPRPDPDPTTADRRHVSYREAAYHGATYERLRQVKVRYDPDGAFQFHRSIPST